jgi:hypothetical protein
MRAILKQLFRHRWSREVSPETKNSIKKAGETGMAIQIVEEPDKWDAMPGLLWEMEPERV